MRRLAAVLAVVPLTLLAAGSPGAPQAPPALPPNAAYPGVEPLPVPPRPSFVLTDTDGKRFDFAAETKGRPTYVYFGYTNCPDECPTAMADIAAALRRVEPGLREKVKVVFVTT